MRTFAVAVAIVAAAACAGRSDDDVERTFEAAQAALWRGNLNEAQTLAERGASIAASTDATAPSAWPWKFRHLLAEVHISRLDFKQALPILDEPIPAAREFDGVRARQKYLLARVQVPRGSFAEAQQSLQEARGLLPADDVETLPDVDALEGQIQFRTGRWADGEARMQAVLAAAARRQDRQRQAKALNDLGMARIRQNRCDEAVSWFERVMNLPGAEEFSLFATALNNAGACLARLGQFDKATAAQRRAIELHERGSRAAYEQALGELGTTYLLQDNVNDALPYLKQAFSIAADANQQDDAATWARNLAGAYIFAGRWEEAEHFNNEARRLTPASRARHLDTLHAARIAAGRGSADAARRLFEEALAGSESEPAVRFSVRWSAHDGLANLALAAGDRRRAADHFEAALDTIEKTRADLLKTDYRLSFSDRAQLIRFYRSYVEMLIAQGEPERALEIADSSRGRVLAEKHGVAAPARVTTAAMRRLARESKAVLLSYWLAPSRSYLWVIGGNAVTLVELPPSGDIEKLVREHQQAIASSLVDPLAAQGAGDRLYATLVAPAAGVVRPDSDVIIVPDGALHGLNFETLPVNGGRRHYWIEDVIVQIAPSLAMLRQAAASGPTSRSLLVFGNAGAREPEFPSLRFAPVEIANVTRHFRNDRVAAYQAERATPAAYRSAGVGEFGLVHFTAHATANVESPLDSAIVLSGTDTFKLYARDVADQPLAAELVTVSACRSAGERAYSGEGLVGFAWAFLRAGARRVIAGLWDVDDRSTAELMDVLYERLARGERPASALHNAKLELVKKGGTFAKPYYWGPFQMFTVVP
jgi:CHAT domain-containing protein